MFYETNGPHGLPHNPFKSCIVPRPIAWISTLSKDGIANLAPYSFFNGVSDAPAMIMFAGGNRADGSPKDTILNIEETNEFVVNMSTWDQRDSMSETSAPVDPNVSEADLLGLETLPSNIVKPSRVKASPIHMECTLQQIIDLPTENPGQRNVIVVGRVLGIHINDEVLVDGLIDLTKIRPLARLGYQDYTSVTEITTIKRPGA